MSLTYSTMMPLGTKAPDFALPDVTSHQTVSFSDLNAKKAVLVIFLCRHCPYVQHIKRELSRLDHDYTPQQVGIIAISSNPPDTYPEDSPESLKELAQEEGYTFPILFDKDQRVAKSYTAACTPDFFLFDKKSKLVYRGQLDDSRPGNGRPVTGQSLRTALDSLLNGEPISADQKPASGCNIKWLPGNGPDYYH